MKIGLKLSPIYVDYALLERTWLTAAESPSFESLWSYDHLYPREGPGPCLEGWTVLAVLASRSMPKIIGHLVLAAPYRHPSMLAKMTTVMDHATAGRFVLGLGAGHRLDEARAFDLPLAEPIGERMIALERTLRWVRALWGSPTHIPADQMVTSPAVPFDSPDGPVYEPGNRTPGGPPIWIGTGGERIGLRLVAAYADGWNHSGTDVNAFARKLEILRSHCAEIDRDPAEIEVSAQIMLGSDETDREEAVRLASAFAAKGCDHLILMAETRLGPDGVRAAEATAQAIRQALG